VTAPDAMSGMRLDQALARLIPQHSRSRLKGWIEAGLVTLDGVAVTEPKWKLRGGEALVVAEAPAPGDTPFTAEAIALSIVHEDDALLVIDKPPGLVVHPGSGNWSGTLLNALLHHVPAQSALPRAGIVHRLDKDTSGLMVVAKSPEAQTDLVRQLQARTVRREYLAVVWGDLARATTIDAPIGRHPTQRTSMAVVASGKPARTHVEILERFGAATLVRCRLETGRTHQIRVHLTALGHPLLGDPTYRGQRTMKGAPPAAARAFARQALHAQRLGLLHPSTRAPMQWESAPPPDFGALVAALRADSAP
jgi:23S rRNA pseudouridine1911/1915/1917 synthase